MNNLSVTIGRTSILDNVSLDVSPRTVFGLVGPSGAGKSTLLRCLNRTMILVTHNLGQARRVTDWVACICPSEFTGAGEMLESACCDAFFDSQTCRRVFHTLADDESPK